MLVKHFRIFECSSRSLMGWVEKSIQSRERIETMLFTPVQQKHIKFKINDAYIRLLKHHI